MTSPSPEVESLSGFTDSSAESCNSTYDVPCSPEWTMASLDKIASDLAKPTSLKILKGSSNFDEWKFYYEQWISDQDPCVTHFCEGLLMHSKTDDSVKIDDSVKVYYRLFTENEIRRLVLMIHTALVHVLKSSLDSKTVRLTWPPNYPYHEMVEEVYAYGKRDQIARDISQLKCLYKKNRSLENLMQYNNIYPTTPVKMEVMNATINPFQHSHKELKSLLKEIEYYNIDDMYAAAREISTAKRAEECNLIMMNFQQLILDEVDELKPGDTIVRAQKKKKANKRKNRRFGKH